MNYASGMIITAMLIGWGNPYRWPSNLVCMCLCKFQIWTHNLGKVSHNERKILKKLHYNQDKNSKIQT